MSDPRACGLLYRHRTYRLITYISFGLGLGNLSEIVHALVLGFLGLYSDVLNVITAGLSSPLWYRTPGRSPSPSQNWGPGCSGSALKTQSPENPSGLRQRGEERRGEERRGRAKENRKREREREREKERERERKGEWEKKRQRERERETRAP